MENLQRRTSGIYVARLTVPERLRHLVGKRELIATTGTSQRAVAKLVAGALLARWRQQLFDLDRLAVTGACMNHDTIIRIADGDPLLAVTGHLPLEQAAAAVGLRPADVLRQAGLGRVRLFHRLHQAHGYLVALDALPEDCEPGSRVIPAPADMPETATRLTATGAHAIPRDALNEVAGALLADLDADIVLFDAPAGCADTLAFVPDEPVTISLGTVEVATEDMERLRRSLAARLAPEAVERARTAAKEAGKGKGAHAGKMAHKRFSEAVAAYCTSPDGLPGTLASLAEQRQRKHGLLLFSEFMGDLRLMDIDGDALRAFRDGPLTTLPAGVNKLPKEIRRDSMKATIAALEADGRDWPLMTRDMQRERMLWLFRMFAWLHDKGYLSPNPAAPLVGETGMSKAERKDLRRKEAAARAAGDLDDDGDEGRGPFSAAELEAIFTQPHFRTGNGVHVTKGNQSWYPFEYWLPLLGLLAGCRIKEACQLHLADVRQVDHVWCLDLNERTADKSLKNEHSTRIVPLHPMLIELGLVAYCERLRRAGYRRVFPELTHASSDARYAKEPVRKMSKMLKDLGMPRDNYHVFHCLRHNANNAMARVPLTVLPGVDDGLKKYIRYMVMGHKPGDDVNVRHYMNTTQQEKAALVAAMDYDLPPIAKFDIEHGLTRVAAAIAKKMGPRRGKEDMGPLNEKLS